MFSRKNHASDEFRLITQPGMGLSAAVTCSSERPLILTVVFVNVLYVWIPLVMSRSPDCSVFDHGSVQRPCAVPTRVNKTESTRKRTRILRKWVVIGFSV